MMSTLKNKLLMGSAAFAIAGGLAGGIQNANAGAFLWVSAPSWSYSAAAAASPVGSIYFWSLSTGFSWAYAFSNDNNGNAAYAYAEAAAGFGGRGAFDVSGLADPYSGLGVDIGELSANTPTDYPSTQPSSSPFTSTYTVGSSGITFSSDSSSELAGSDAIQAFSYSGTTSETAVETALGVSGTSGNTSLGDVTNIGTLASDLNLLPLDSAVSDPSSNTLSFTENTSSLNSTDTNVILVGEGTAPEPAAAALLLAGTGTLLLIGRRRFSR